MYPMGFSQTAHGIVQGFGSDAMTRWASSMEHWIQTPILGSAGDGHWVHLLIGLFVPFIFGIDQRQIVGFVIFVR